MLPYSVEQTGLHLHGLNLNQADLLTVPAPAVKAFAREWGFIPTEYIILSTVKEVKEFTDECAETGTWRGQHVEGFVVRAATPGAHDDRQAFMWKVKFDEPYLMWREWRELSRKMITMHLKEVEGKGKDKGKDAAQDKNRNKQRAETRLYVQWVEHKLNSTKPDEGMKMFATFNSGRGIVAVRNAFLDWLGSDQGQKELAALQESKSKQGGKAKNDRPFDKTLLVPIAIPGCGMSGHVICSLSFSQSHFSSQARL